MKLRLAAPKVKVADLYPELKAIAVGVSGRDWASVARHVAALPPGIDGAQAILAGVEVPKSETFLEQVVATERVSSLPRVMLAARYIVLAWEARSALMPKHVSTNQFAVFFDYLRQADALLSQAVSDDPGDAVAWSFRVTTARGLQLGHAEARRRYAKAAEVGPHYLYAQMSMLQQLCPKWGGNWPDVRAFIDECVRAAGPGGLSGGLVAEGFIEYVRAEVPGEAPQVAYYRQPAVQAELDLAAAGSVFDAAYRPLPGWVWAHNVFGYAHWRAGLHSKAAVHFRILDDKAGHTPWQFYSNPGDMFLGARNGSIRRAK